MQPVVFPKFQYRAPESRKSVAFNTGIRAALEAPALRAPAFGGGVLSGFMDWDVSCAESKRSTSGPGASCLSAFHGAVGADIDDADLFGGADSDFPLGVSGLSEGALEIGHWIMFGIMLVPFLGALQPRMWRQWIVLAADKRGIYIANHLWKYLFVPWNDVGTVEVGQIIGGRSVILELRVADELWTEAFGWHPFPSEKKGNRGFRKLGLRRNSGRKPETIRAAIERIRTQSGAAAAV